MAQPVTPPSHPRAVLVRHGETAWSLSGQHTSVTDLPLTERGRAMAARIGAQLRGRPFAAVFSSPRLRALETCRLAGFGEAARLRDELAEWDYGRYEGLTTPQIREQQPSWSLWRDGAPGGESPQQVQERIDRVIAEIRGLSGDALIFAHGHILRVLTARWLEQPVVDGRLYALATATISELGYEREQPVLTRWNDDCHCTD